MATRQKKKTQRVQSVPVLQPDAAGIDIGAVEVFVAVPVDRDTNPVRHFNMFTEDLHALAEWLKACRIKTVAMESTGVYWIPLFQILETQGFEVCLVNARHVKNVPGRKTDVQDGQWLQYLHSVGLLRGSFRPPQQVCEVRSLLRHRDNMIKIASSHVQHMQKALTQMNLQIHHVISDITGVTGLAIVDAILEGVRDPHRLAELKDGRIKAEKDVIAKSLVGDYRREHIFTLKQALQSYRHYQQMILECDREIEKYLSDFESQLNADEKPLDTAKSRRRKPRANEPYFDLRSHLHRILGTDLTTVPGINVLIAHVIFTELGSDLSKFPTADHFCSWLGLCPNNKISGGKILSSKVRSGSNRVAQALRMAAQSLWRTENYLGHYFRRMRGKLGAPKAITATAHKLARIVYHLLKHRKPFDDTVFAEQEQKHATRITVRLKAQAQALGFKLVPVDAVEGVS
jgi:transposase